MSAIHNIADASSAGPRKQSPLPPPPRAPSPVPFIGDIPLLSSSEPSLPSSRTRHTHSPGESPSPPPPSRHRAPSQNSDDTSSLLPAFLADGSFVDSDNNDTFFPPHRRITNANNEKSSSYAATRSRSINSREELYNSYTHTQVQQQKFSPSFLAETESFRRHKAASAKSMAAQVRKTGPYTLRAVHRSETPFR
mmetsp:Transcript_38722/g.62725  ORF Transcript_38722/g.62725 Transcript_38722/m.62725 type:complete len:194 (-) Transcript_38722:216-797(-)